MRYFTKIIAITSDSNVLNARIRRFSDRRVVITGIGAICPLGLTALTSWDGLLNEKCGIRKLTGPEYENLPCKIAAVIPREGSNSLQLENHFSKSFIKTISTATALALIAADEALTDADWKPNDERCKENTGVALGIGMADLQDVCDTKDALDKGYNKVSPYFIPRILPNMAAGQISIKYGFRGPNHSVSTACATGAHSIGDGFRFIKSNNADVMVCGGAESPINPISIAGFCRLRALSTSCNERPNEASRPFDKLRDGFVMGEGSAVLILEELEHARRRNAKIYAEVLGYGLSGDASHMTAPKEDGSGAILSMKRALTDARLNPEDVGYINAHATSTPVGDVIESRSIKAIFGDRPWISSTKGAHGHLLGAAGNLEALFTVLACFHGIVPPTLNLQDTTDVEVLKYVTKPQEWKSNSRRIALKNSFGFGGTNATLCFGEYQ